MMELEGCIYGCGPAPSTQEYHLYPASASKVDVTLPPGVVCDGCNSYFSKLESYFIHHHPGSSMRVWNGVLTKKGKTPKFAHENGELTRVDREEDRQVTTRLGDLRVERHLDGNLTIIGAYNPPPFDASKVSRVLHKIAFEFLVADFGQDFGPADDRFVPLREFVRRPKSGLDFQPFAWSRYSGPPRLPSFASATDTDSGEWIADVCLLTFPGIEYWVAYPPWPVPDRLWACFPEGTTVVDSPGMISLKPEELRIPLIRTDAVASNSDE